MNGILSFIIGFLLFSEAYSSEFVPDEVIVQFKKGISVASKGSIFRTGGIVHAKTLGKTGMDKLKLDYGQSVEEVIAKLKKNPDVIHVQPNFIYHATAIPNDPSFSQSWGMKNTGQTIVKANGPEVPSSEKNPGSAGKDFGIVNVWDYSTSCDSVVVAVVDSGVNYDHADLASNMWDGGTNYPKHGYDFSDDDLDPMDLGGHGTHVAGVIGAVGNNSIGTAGVCWNAKIMAVRVLNSVGLGTTSDIIQGINFAVNQGAKVVNMSLGGGSFDSAMSSTISAAKSNGVLFVVAAGNASINTDNGSSPLVYPCAFNHDNLICVAALNQDFTLASYSNFGSTSVDVGAPGTNVLSNWNGAITAAVTDPLTTGWTRSSPNANGWGSKNLNFGGQITSCMVNPVNYDFSNNYYLNNADDRAYKSFNLSTSADSYFLKFDLMHDLQENADYLSVHIKNSSGDPVINGIELEAFTGSSGAFKYSYQFDISDFATSATTVGFRLYSNSSVNALGVNISDFAINKLTINDSTYNVISGTSMAAPHVAGLAAMLFTYNPNYTYLEVFEAIKSGGVSAPALVGKSVTGKAANAQGSMSYLPKPTGVSATVNP